MSEEETRKGPPTHAEVRADERAKVESEMSQQMEAMLKRMAQMERDINEASGGKIRASKLRRRTSLSNEQAQGIAHATGGASHPDPSPEEPWTPTPPDWVTSTRNPEQQATATFVWKQAWLDGQPLTNNELLRDAVAAFEDTGEIVGRAGAFDVNAQLAAVAVE